MNLDITTTKLVKIGTDSSSVSSITDMSKFVNFKRLINLTRVEIYFK